MSSVFVAAEHSVLLKLASDRLNAERSCCARRICFSPVSKADKFHESLGETPLQTEAATDSLPVFCNLPLSRVASRPPERLDAGTRSATP